MLGTIHHSVPLHLTIQPLLAILQPESMWHTAIESLPITLIAIRQYSRTTFELGVLMSCNYARLGVRVYTHTRAFSRASERLYTHVVTPRAHLRSRTKMLHFSTSDSCYCTNS